MKTIALVSNDFNPKSLFSAGAAVAPRVSLCSFEPEWVTVSDEQYDLLKGSNWIVVDKLESIGQARILTIIQELQELELVKLEANKCAEQKRLNKLARDRASRQRRAGEKRIAGRAAAVAAVKKSQVVDHQCPEPLTNAELQEMKELQRLVSKYGFVLTKSW